MSSSSRHDFHYDEFGFLSGNTQRYESKNGDFSFGEGVTPWSNPEAYIRNSPIALADRIRTPVLLINTDMDNFAVSQFEAMFAALYRLKKVARFLTYWGEGHTLVSPANLRHEWESVIDWYDQHLVVSRDGDASREM